MAKHKTFMVPIEFHLDSANCNFCGTWKKRCARRSAQHDARICIDCVVGIYNGISK